MNSPESQTALQPVGNTADVLEEGLPLEVASCIAQTLGSLFYAVYHIWMEDRTYACYREELDSILPVIGARGNAEEAFDTYISNFIEPADREGMRTFVDFDTLADRLSQSDSVSHEYRRLGVGWARCRFLVSRRDEEGRPSHLVFVVCDINTERDLAAKEASASYASRHDALTGALNRMAFDEAVSEHVCAGEPIGFALVDIDSFKALNDEHGHGFGDVAISKVSEAMHAVFRPNDMVFRIGGDEFAVILRECQVESWGVICEKFERIHRSLSTVMPEGGDVTLSSGFCFGPSGYEEWMFDIADKGLYASKERGRAGCTLMRKNGTVAGVWRDDAASVRPFAALACTDSGTGRIEIPHDKTMKPRLFCGATLEKLYRIPEGLSPEERFAYWREGVDETYANTLFRAYQQMLHKGNVECTFLWGRKGINPFYVRAVGGGKVEEDADILYGVHRSLENASLIQREDKANLVISAQNRAYVCSYIVDLQTNTLSVLKQSPTAWTVDIEGLDGRSALLALVNRLVCKEDLSGALAFADTSTLPQRMGNEFSLSEDHRSTTESGWCRATWFPIEEDAEGNLVSALYAVASIDSAKQEEMRRERESAQSMSLYYEAAETMLGTQIVSMALFDRQTGKGKAWLRHKGFIQPTDVEFDALVQWEAAYVAEGARTQFVEDVSLQKVIVAVDANGHYEAPVRYVLPTGEIRHFTYHFAAYSHNPAQLFVVVEDSTASYMQEGRRIEDLYDSVPGGLVSYEWSDGVLAPIQVSKRYCELFGQPMTVLPDGSGTNEERLHPDDRAGYLREVTLALIEKHEAHHSYREWVARRNCYVWVKIDAAARNMEDGRTLVYAMYSDVTELMEAKLALAKTSKSLEGALKTASQMIWEYDPEAHVATCYTETNAMGLPRVIENYPESLKDYDIFLPEYDVIFRETVHKIDQGEPSASCRTKILVNGESRWFSCKLFAQEDPVLGRRMATLFVTDINVRVAASKAFENRMEALLYSGNSSYGMGVYNITRDEVIEIHTQASEYLPKEASHEYGAALAAVVQCIEDPRAREECISKFSRENLLRMIEAGEARASMECLYRTGPHRTEWMELSVELVANPVSAEVEAITFAKNINELCLSNMLIRQLLKGSYNAAAILYDEGTEYYLFDAATKRICSHHEDYWGDLHRVLEALCGAVELKRVAPLVAKDAVLAQLAAGVSPRVAFDGSLYGENYRFEIRFSKDSQQEGVIFVSVRDITDGAMLEKLQHDARHDALTGLYNRNAVFAKCEKLLQQHPDKTFAMLKINVRRFRLYNAFYGEAAGDELLREVARQMAEALSPFPESAYGRMESDIFCMVFPLDEGRLTQGIQSIEQRFRSYREDFPLEPSIGVYVMTDRDIPIEGMFARASSAAKEGGTRLSDCAWLYNDGLERKLETEIGIARDMQTALNQEQFLVYLQPKFDLQMGTRVGAEALVRWKHPKKGMVSPGAFIPVFEHNGFIASLDRYMWEHVCKLIRRWLDQGRQVLPVSVNVSRVSAYDPTTVPFLIDLVKRYDIDPALMELELTESAYIADPDEIRRNMKTLQQAGFRFLMDDFGSGYSSLNTLRNLPVDVVKLDIGFLSETCDDERGRAVIESVLLMTKRLGLPVIAEGVENEQQASFLRSAGCEYVQGYLYARPMPVASYERLE